MMEKIEKNNYTKVWSSTSLSSDEDFGERGCGNIIKNSEDIFETEAGNSGNNVKLWNADTGKQLAVMEGHEHGVIYADFSPDGQYIVTGCGSISKSGDILEAENAARIWDYSGNQLAVMRGHGAGVKNAAFSPNGRYLVTASWDNTARLWEVNTGKQIYIMQGHESLLLYSAFSPDGSHIVTASSDNTARIWETATGKQIHLLGNIDKRIIESVESFKERMYDPDGPLFQDYRMITDMHTDNINCAVFSSDGKSVLTASDDNTARIWDTNTGKQLAVLKGHKNSIHHAGFTSDGQYIITASSDKTVRIWRFFTTTQSLTDYANKIISYKFTCEDHQKFFLEVTEECCFVNDKNIKGIYQGECKDGKVISEKEYTNSDTRFRINPNIPFR
ncbi:MAG: WD40 repeat domain-containing protein [Desulfobacteraceae bacterium]|nr:WD40 repeat domain-containing protein [Desulfobacteraceae bacterium]